ncbi:hypothetical protein [Hymenobacter sp. BT559]|uniref:hypothetical protein n=1 Tax=Hymenobacter sp. BT559 TaxID=2795729 RepID=UPI0018EB002B|nr:hypothetical protein [Hymenobacter sp. BT559]
MNSLTNLSGMLQDPDFQERFVDEVSGEARRNHSFIAYLDEQGRMVREYPATGEVFQPSADRKTMRLLSLNGKAVEAAAPIEVEATPHRLTPVVLAGQ